MKEEKENTKMSIKDFFKEISLSFPESENRLSEWDRDQDLPHLRMTGLASFAFKYLENGEKEKFKSIIDL